MPGDARSSLATPSKGLEFPEDFPDFRRISYFLPKEGYQGCRNLGIRDLDSRNERIRIIAFQNIQNFKNRSSKNIFPAPRKLMKNIYDIYIIYHGNWYSAS